MGRTALVYVPSAVVLAVCWLRLESPRAARDAVVLLVLALLPALAPTLRLRLAAAVVAALVAARVALDVSPLDEAALWQLLSDGVLEFYDVSVPFRPGEHSEMHGALLVGLFASALLVALAIAARRPFLAVLALVVGAGWPATLVTDGQELVLGTAILAAALWTLAALSARSLAAFAPAAVAGVAVVALAGGAAATDAVARDAVLRWERWDLYDAPATPVGLDYVWDAQYAGIDFPDRRTVVLRIEAPERAQYWRATTLDAFAVKEDHWFETLYPLVTDFDGGRLPDDELVPDQPQEQWLRQEVTVVGLRDDHLVAAAPAVQLRPDGFGVVVLNGGVARVAGGLRNGQTYTVWSAVRRPSAEQLAQLPARYPRELDVQRDVDPNVRVLPFRHVDRPEQLRRFWTDDRTSHLRAYRPLVETALRLTREARTPYAAVVALEDWFRSTGGFVYDEQPAQTGVAPPLVEFVTRTKAGYCQHYAGAMALMLRYLGIPARVAVGFTSGRFKDGIWTVTDHEAHAWVEVWFPGQGWLSFDPTPGRGRLSALYTLASDSADAIRQTRDAAQGVGGGLDPTAGGDLFGPGAVADDGTGWRIAATVAAVLALLVLAIGLLKLALRRFRSLTSDGRRRAAAYRNELADFLRDQGLDVPASATLDDLQRVLATELGVDGSAFVDAAGAARYGPPDGIERSLLRARRELRSVLKAVRARLSTGERLRGWLAVRSLRRA